MLHLKPNHRPQNININQDAQPDTTKKETTTLSELGSSVDLGGRSDWGNKLVVNTGDNPVINFAFMLRVEGVFDLPCKSVKGIRRENEFDYIQEGGLNDYVHLKRKAISKPFTFQVERYVGVNWVDPMPLGTELVLPLILFVNNQSFPTLKPVRNYVFTGCTVIGKDYGELNAEVSGLLVETVTIAYREMVCLDIPNDTLTSDDVWKFKEKTKQGEGPRHFNSNFLNTDWESSDYNAKESMAERAVKWSPHDVTKSKSAKHNDKEATKKEMIEDASLWEINEWTEKEKNKNTSAKHNDSEPTEEDMIANADLWKINEWTEKEKNKNTLAKHNDSEPTEKEMIANADLWKIKEWTEKEKNKNTLAKHNDSEPSRATMEANAIKWDPVDDDPSYGKDYSKLVTDMNQEIEEQIEQAETAEEAAEAAEMEEALSDSKTRKYEHSSTPKQYSSAKHNADELSKETMEGYAIKWDPVDDDPSYGKDYSKFVTDMNQEIENQVEQAETAEEAAEAAEMEDALSDSKTRKYEHSSTPKQYSSAKHNESEPSKATMEANAIQWDPTDDDPSYGKDYGKLVTEMTEGEETDGAGEESTETVESGRLWPKTSSARKEAMVTPTPRLWPKTKSAKQITDFLKKH